MYFSFAKSCALALAAASSALSQTDGFDVITNPDSAGVTLPAGETFDITWDPSPAPLDGKITIVLLQGTSEALLQTGDTIASKLYSAIISTYTT
jgi:hypothetical protein